MEGGSSVPEFGVARNYPMHTSLYTEQTSTTRSSTTHQNSHSRHQHNYASTTRYHHPHQHHGEAATEHSEPRNRNTYNHIDVVDSYEEQRRIRLENNNGSRRLRSELLDELIDAKVSGYQNTARPVTSEDEWQTISNLCETYARRPSMQTTTANNTYHQHNGDNSATTASDANPHARNNSIGNTTNPQYQIDQRRPSHPPILPQRQRVPLPSSSSSRPQEQPLQPSSRPVLKTTASYRNNMSADESDHDEDHFDEPPLRRPSNPTTTITTIPERFVDDAAVVEEGPQGFVALQQRRASNFRQEIQALVNRRRLRRIPYQRAVNPGAVRVNSAPSHGSRPVWDVEMPSSSSSSPSNPNNRERSANEPYRTTITEESGAISLPQEESREEEREQEVNPAQQESVDTETRSSKYLRLRKLLFEKRLYIKVGIITLISGGMVMLFTGLLVMGSPTFWSSRELRIREALEEFTPVSTLDDPASPQHNAWQWLYLLDKTITFDTDDLVLAQRYAALVLYYASQGSSSSSSSGSSSTHHIILDGDDDDALQRDAHECDWGLFDCVDIGTKRTIVEIQLSLVGIKELPPEIGLLTSLETLDVSLLSLKSLPNTMGSLGSLKSLIASRNSLTEIPVAIFELSSLEKLDLSSNAIGGTINEALGGLPKLKYLNLQRNIIGGKLPNSLNNLSNLEYLYLGYNDLTGLDPGTLPAQLRELGLRLNDFEFELSRVMGELSSLEYFEARSNRIYGVIPPTIGALSNLQVLYLSRNNIKGTVPETIGNLSRLEELWLFENKLTGGISPSMGMMTQLKSLVIHSNRLSGSIPTTLGRLTNIVGFSLANNELTGRIPTELGRLQQLEQMILHQNLLSGSVPTEVCFLQTSGNLTDIEVDAFVQCTCC